MVKIRKIIIFGSTGNTGLCCVNAAVKLGYDTTAFLRDPSKLPAEISEKVKVVVGDVTNAAQVEAALEGHDAVVSALGTRNDLSPTTVMSDGTKNIIMGMNKWNIHRITACTSAFLFWDRSKVPERFHPLTEDHERVLEALKQSDREWIAVMPPHISDNPGCEDYIVIHGKGPGRIISKHDLGHFMVSSLTKDEHLYQSCGICGKPQETK